MHASEKFTNVATRKTLTLHTDFVGQEVPVTDNGHGTLTHIVRTPGAARVTGRDGRLLALKTGVTINEVLRDDGGTPGDPTDDSVLSEPRSVLTGIHSLDARDFCADIVELTS